MYHYIHLKISPPSIDILTLRKTIANALSQSFGLQEEGTYLDILSLAEDGTECILRVRPECVLLSRCVFKSSVNGLFISDASKILASLVTWSENRQFSLVKETPFLPSLLVVPFL